MLYLLLHVLKISEGTLLLPFHLLLEVPQVPLLLPHQKHHLLRVQLLLHAWNACPQAPPTRAQIGWLGESGARGVLLGQIAFAEHAEFLLGTRLSRGVEEGLGGRTGGEDSGGWELFVVVEGVLAGTDVHLL